MKARPLTSAWPEIAHGDVRAVEAVAFSLFEDDNMRKVYAALGLGQRVRFRMVKRSFC